MSQIRIGTAGWSVPKAVSGAFPGEGPILARYARGLTCVEINTSFYRSHRRSTYERWAATTPEGFSFAVKAPRTVTHAGRLRDTAPLAAFFAEIAGLGTKLGPVLIQLPPSLAFEPALADFFEAWRKQFGGLTACEPRHRSWFGPEAEALLSDHRIARVAADPAVLPEAASPGGWPGLVYVRWHGSPQMYASAYTPAALETAATLLARLAPETPAWFIFDNTMYGAAAADALDLSRLIGGNAFHFGAAQSRLAPNAADADSRSYR